MPLDVEEELTPEEKWSAGYQQGRRDAATSTRIARLEERMDRFERHFNEDLMPQIVTMGASLKTLADESTKTKSDWRWWWDVGARIIAILYRAAVLVMFIAVFTHNTELGKALAPWLLKWIP